MKEFFNDWFAKTNRTRSEQEASECIRVHARRDGSMAIFIDRCPVYEIRKETDLSKGVIGIDDVPAILDTLRNRYIEDNK